MHWYRHALEEQQPPQPPAKPQSPANAMTIAMVGSTKSELERAARILIEDWLKTNLPKHGPLTEDHINLNEGRDFLTESKTYDIVAICWIYNQPGKTGYWQTSPVHRKDIWVRRLVRTNAKLIFTFGWETEVNAQWLGPIPGYKPPVQFSTAELYIQDSVSL